ncbi:MAG TPA: hypothetical protein VMH50_14220 [Thermoleophilia bacterium]|nr:hypothetical protein [Thermoleophilia bacterium]
MESVRLLRALLVVLLAACWMAPRAAPPPEPVYLHAPPERVWSALVAVFTDSGIQFEAMNRSSWFMRTSWTRVLDFGRGPNVDCGRSIGGLPRPKDEAAAVRYTATLRPAGDSTGVLLVMTALTMEDRYTTIACASTRTAEARLLAEVSRRLQAAP